MKFVFQLLKKILGPDLTERIRPLGHGVKAWLAALYFGFPARQLTVIGINGTKGKTSTVVLTGRLMNKAGIKTGYISTAALYTGTGNAGESTAPLEQQNTNKMTTVDAVLLQKLLKTMLRHGCTHVILEMSSQGLAQHRHWGIGSFDTTVFLNAYPEHLEAHGGWENYLKAKQLLFKQTRDGGYYLGNGDDQEAETMWQAIRRPAQVKKRLLYQHKDYFISRTPTGRYILGMPAPTGVILSPSTHAFNTNQPLNEFQYEFDAAFEAVNTAFALSLVSYYYSSDTLPAEIYKPTSSDMHIPGRMHWVVRCGVTDTCDRNLPISIIVDYAHEPESIKQLLQSLRQRVDAEKTGFLIHVLSSDGVGRDDWKKPIMGLESRKFADFTVFTTDNYGPHDNPHAIVSLLTSQINTHDNGYTVEIHRKKAFDMALKKAVHEAKKGIECLIVSTGVGNEYGLTQPHGIMKWNEAEVWQEIWCTFPI